MDTSMSELQNKLKTNVDLLKTRYNKHKEQIKKFNLDLHNNDSVILSKIALINETSSTDELLEIYKNIIPREKLLKELYIYEFLNQTEPSQKLTNTDDIVKLINKSLDKYQWIVGGYQIEDKYWKMEVDNSKEFKISKNDILLSNTLAFPDDDSKWFMKSFITYIRKFIDNEKISVCFKFKEDELLELVFVLIVIRNKLN